MLAEQCGKLIKEARVLKGLRQEELAGKARVSRAILSGLERGKSKAVQSDTLDRILVALELRPQFGQSEHEHLRGIARLEHEIELRDRRERHLRLAVDLGTDPIRARAKVARARKRVELWRRDKLCSPLYIERWTKLLALPPREMARRMSSLGEWEGAMFQNSPWSWAWT